MLSGPITGAHINPALSISLMTIRKLKPLQCFFYVIGQILGAFLGAALVYIVYLKQFDEFDGGIREMTGPNGTADIFFTMPAKGTPQWNALVDQIVGTAILMIFVMAVTHELNQMMSKAVEPLAFALIVTGIISAFSINAGAAINPARDLGPRLFGAFVYGWNNVFGVHNYFFWVPIVGPIVGAIVGVWLHQGFIWIVKHYGHLSNIEDSNANKKIDSKAIQIKENDSLDFDANSQL
ncbi:unnamed protein product [Rotaria sordida]|uniref:Aquaporin n=1 Tax=Rotaria sordida TaxID=392033 RepID=A0A814DIC4_9BILA|nr:unnamed protein product [Rotaria sordida]CAF3682737.1 unnamed protein product [Rotaria sordida]